MNNLDTGGFMDLISGVNGGQFVYVDDMALDSCYPDVEQPRYKNLTEEGVQDILATLPKTQGRIWQPIIVRDEDQQGHQILMGGRRWLACKIYGLATIPVIIVKGDVDSALFLQLMENIARKPLDIREEGRAYKLLKAQGQEQKEIAASLGKSAAYITEALMMHDMETTDELAFINQLYEDKVCQDTSTLAVLIRLARKNEHKTKQLIAWAIEHDCLNRKWAKSLSIKDLETPIDDQRLGLAERKQYEQRPNSTAHTPAGMTDGNPNETNDDLPLASEKPVGMTDGAPNETDEDLQLVIEQCDNEHRQFLKKPVTAIHVMHNNKTAKLLLDQADQDKGFAWIEYDNSALSAIRVNVSELSLIDVG